MGTPGRNLALSPARQLTGSPAAEAARSDMQGSYSVATTQSTQQATSTAAAAASPTSFNVRVLTSVAVNPTPSIDTIVDGLQITVPPQTKPVTALVSANVSFNSAHNNRFRLYLDTTIEYPTQGYLPAAGPTTGNDYHFSATQIPVPIPGDNRSHTITLKYIQQTATTLTTLQDRSLQVTL